MTAGSSTGLAGRVDGLVHQPGYRPPNPWGTPLPDADTCWRCTKQPVTDGSTLCAPCRAWLRGETDERPWSPGRHYLERAAVIMAEMEDKGWLTVPEGERREIL